MSAVPLPCPFCGGKSAISTVTYEPYFARKTFQTTQTKFFRVSCVLCCAMTDALRGARTEATAIRHWNRRTA